MLHAARKHALHLLVPGANRRPRYDCWDWRVQERHVESLNHSLNFVDPNTGAHTQCIENTWWGVKQSMPRTGTYEDPSLRKLSKEMVVAPALWRWSIWIHYQAYRRLVWSMQRRVNCSLYHCTHCSWYDRHFLEERNKIHSFIEWDWIWGR